MCAKDADVHKIKPGQLQRPHQSLPQRLVKLGNPPQMTLIQAGE